MELDHIFDNIDDSIDSIRTTDEEKDFYAELQKCDLRCAKGHAMLRFMTNGMICCYLFYITGMQM